jgi:hypothetical protein
MATPHRDHHIGPTLDSNTTDVLTDALAALARRHTPQYCLDDPAVTLHLLTSLHHQIQAALPAAVARARDHNLSWAEIGDLLGTTRAAAWNRYGHHTPTAPPPNQHHPQ